MPTMPPDNYKISLKLIEAIKQHPVLYISEVKGSAIKLQEFRQKVWKRIADELGLDPCWVRSKWKNLRDTYCRILKSKKKIHRGNRKKKWIFEDQLSFMKFPYEPDYQPQCVELSDEYIDDINSTGMNCDSLLEQLEDRSDEDYSEYLEVLEDTTDDPVLPSGSHVIATLDGTFYQTSDNNGEHENIDYDETIQSKYIEIQSSKNIKIHNDNNVNETNDNVCQNNTMPIIIETRTVDDTNNIICQNNDDENTLSLMVKSQPKTSLELFFDSMAQTVKTLPPKAQAEIKLNVCRIVTAAETKYLKNKTTITQFIAPPGMIPKLVLIPCSMIDN
ncbi:uncharacterized protein LOC122859320 [Aphidius gifuensis]|uniref:uncharacterized protein LOC122859320 n=1 Tax=Aphidius gifuensis TaxID=684658 RepID=UPI001CDD29C7|nr:uncharacterized protein LOC122859320 [Aphidius gifuensis]XP_044018730.1 uncharacterized protein LOC122859320 [Aphidius gifuensis]